VVDGRDDYGEERCLTIGWVAPAISVIACTLRRSRGEVICIISTRKAKSSEQDIHHEMQA
jgi:uncharacterized DUF497 family protein